MLVSTDNNVDFSSSSQSQSRTQERAGRVRCAFDTRNSVVENNPISKIRRHDEIVLWKTKNKKKKIFKNKNTTFVFVYIVTDAKEGFSGMHDESFDHFCGGNALLWVEIGGGLVDEIDVGRLAQTQHNSNPLIMTMMMRIQREQTHKQTNKQTNKQTHKQF